MSDENQNGAMGNSDLGVYAFDPAAESTDKEAGTETPLKDRVLVIERSTTYRLTFQEMHDLRAMHVQAAEGALKEKARAEEAYADAMKSVENWTKEIEKASQDIPELAPFSGLDEEKHGVKSPVQPTDLQKDEGTDTPEGS